MIGDFPMKIQRSGDYSDGGRLTMARKTVMVCDNCGTEIEDGRGALVRATYNDARRGAKQADFCDNCTGTLAGHAVARRGRKPKTAA